ncbi:MULTISPECIES: sugar kinase [Streptomyces]|uniref:Sugar kinase n=1 Tax=Streptomyces caniscabiei TaxID=2746961 RepID=A0ABU4MVR5_9ACTN|nr:MULTISPECIES: sugar kinase [Streptomyces]MDX2947120.1 sugar kinase [Streptomyces caniscabiei]MDX2953959.1 sugar kinase [Streptomyces caniscabiei]MDX2982952.1 sugar kinase [Streptomyces caniscabiei]MDX3013754.1 sugar kinase [Streptomyces caniscabiei]MDX3041318.1 sugar kinase [Streptomyces caniscabiei]
MAALRAHGALRMGGSLGLSVAGAESNVAIGLARLGHRVRWAGRVGADELGALVLRTLRAEGIDLSHAATDDTGRPTGVLLTEPRLGTLTRVSYYRTGSAGSAVTPAGVLPALASGTRVLHLTGITPALGPSAAETVAAAATAARDAGITVCLDVNYRSRLWTADRARATLRPLLAHTDLLVASEDELPLVLQDPAVDESEAVKSLLDAGVQEVIVKRGAHGATVVSAEGTVDRAARQVDAVDLVGAGDAFVAGYLSGLLDGANVEDRLHRAVTTAAFAVATRGDWEGLPTRDELGLFDEPDGTTVR